MLTENDSRIDWDYTDNTISRNVGLVDCVVERVTDEPPADWKSNGQKPMLFMIIETFRDNDMLPIYQELLTRGRKLPDGLRYVDSWIEPNFARCFQLMETDDLRTIQSWVLSWRGSGASFEIVPVVTSKDTRETIAPYLETQKSAT